MRILPPATPTTLDASLIVNRSLVLLLALVGLGTPLVAQQADQSLLTVQRIYGSAEFSAQPFGPSRWLDSGRSATSLARRMGWHDGRYVQAAVGGAA